MAKKSMIIKAQRTPKYSTRKYNADICGSSKCVVFVSARMQV